MPCLLNNAKVLSFQPFAESCVKEHFHRASKRHDALFPTTHLDHIAKKQNPVSSDQASNNSGWQRLRHVYKLLDKFDNMEGFRRNLMQRKAHENYIQASLRIIMGKDFVNNVGRLRQMYRLKHLRQEALVAAPRRFGKTFSTAMFCAVMMIAIGLVTIACFSTGRRASRAFLLTVHKMLEALGCGSQIKEFNEESMTLVDKHDSTDKRTIKSFPSRPQIESSSPEDLFFFLFFPTSIFFFIFTKRIFFYFLFPTFFFF